MTTNLRMRIEALPTQVRLNPNGGPYLILIERPAVLAILDSEPHAAQIRLLSFAGMVADFCNDPSVVKEARRILDSNPEAGRTLPVACPECGHPAAYHSEIGCTKRHCGCDWEAA